MLIEAVRCENMMRVGGAENPLSRKMTHGIRGVNKGRTGANH